MTLTGKRLEILIIQSVCLFIVAATTAARIWANMSHMRKSQAKASDLHWRENVLMAAAVVSTWSNADRAC